MALSLLPTVLVPSFRTGSFTPLPDGDRGRQVRQSAGRFGLCLRTRSSLLGLRRAPSENLIGLDLRQDFIDLGYELFNDRSTLKTRFLIQDFFVDTPEMADLLGKIDIISTGYFLHSWDWDGQLQCAKRMIQLMSPDQGAMMTGIQFGSHATGLWSTTPTGVDAGPMFLHDDQTLSKLWGQAARETQTSWEVQVTTEEDQECASFDPQGCHLRWVVTRK